MRLSIRWQLALVSVALSLLPIALAGILAYRSARGALEERIQFNLETLASLSGEKLHRLLLDRHQAFAGGRSSASSRTTPSRETRTAAFSSSSAKPSAISTSIRKSGWRMRPGR